MDRKLATIRKISEVVHHPNADKLDIVTIDGWNCVAKKDEFKPGDLCIYFEIDSILPEIPYFEFMKQRKYRVKTIKLRGEISQGLAIPVEDVLPNKKVKEGDDVTTIIGVKKYIPPSERELYSVPNLKKKKPNFIHKYFLRYHWYRKLFWREARRNWPEFIQKTDEPRIQNYIKEYIKNKNIDVVVTEKIDGQSGTFFAERKRGIFGNKYNFGVCSRNIYKPTDDNSNWWKVAKKFDLKNKMIKYLNETKSDKLVIQGEIIGPKIQGNKYRVDDFDLFVFNVFEYRDKKRKSYDYSYTLCFCNRMGLRVVPFICREFLHKKTIREWVNFSKGKSKLCGTLREGIVIRDGETNGVRFSCKAINPEFLLKHGE